MGPTGQCINGDIKISADKWRGHLRVVPEVLPVLGELSHAGCTCRVGQGACALRLVPPLGCTSQQRAKGMGPSRAWHSRQGWQASPPQV